MSTKADIFILQSKYLTLIAEQLQGILDSLQEYNIELNKLLDSLEEKQ